MMVARGKSEAGGFAVEGRGRWSLSLSRGRDDDVDVDGSGVIGEEERLVCCAAGVVVAVAVTVEDLTWSGVRVVWGPSPKGLARGREKTPVTEM